MMVRKKVTTLLEDKEARQAQLYAKDLHDLYQSERRKREELAEERLVLTYKLHEIEALNRLFQSHLKQRIEIERVCRELIGQIEELLVESAHEEITGRLKKLLEKAEAGIAKVGLSQEDSRPEY